MLGDNSLFFDDNYEDINFIFNDFNIKNQINKDKLNLFQENSIDENYSKKNEESNNKNIMKEKVQNAKKAFMLKKENNKQGKVFFKLQNDKDKILQELILKKELLKKRNREASQKSRIKKKEELQLLYNENQKLKNEIQEIHNKIDLLCSHCKCIFHENIENNSDNIILSNDTTNYFSSFTSVSTQRIFAFSFISVFLIIFTLFLTDNYQNKNGIRNLQIKMIEEKKIINNNNYTSIKNLPKIIIDDHILQKNYYMNFDDYTKLTNNNKDICHIDSYLNINNDNNHSELNSKKSEFNQTINSVYFKMFMPLCDNDNGKHNHQESFFLEKENNENKQNCEQDFYYEVKCKVMDFNKTFKT